MKKIILAFLLLTSVAYGEEYVDGKLFDEFEVTQWDGMSQPSTAPSNTARVYFDKTSHTLNLSQHGNYNPILTGVNVHGIYTPIDHQHPLYSTTTSLGQVANLLGTHQHSSYLTDAPADGSTYGRNNNAWAVAGGTGSGPHLHPQYTPLADYSIHTHPNYAPSGSYANATHAHSIYDTEIQAVASIATTNQHDVSYPGKTQFQQLYSIATTNQHPESYPTIASLSGVANTLGTHQHNVSYPSASQFQLLSQAVGTNAHANYYADINHQHTTYATGASLGTVANTLGTHTHSNYTSIDHQHSTYATGGSLGTVANTLGTHSHTIYQTGIQTVASNLGTHQHDVSYPSANQFQLLSSIATTNVHPNYQASGSFASASHIHANYEANIQAVFGIATTNTHAVASTTAAGFAPIRSNIVTEFLNGTGAYSTPAGGPGGGGSTHSITQAGHGFSVGNAIKFSGGVYAKAQADNSADAEVIGLVTAVAGVNDFTFISGGYHGTMSGKTAGSVYYLDPSTAGALTTTEPTTVGQISKPVIIATSASDGFFYNFRGVEIQSSTSGVDSFETLVSPQGLQGIEQLRHNVASYQNYGNVIIDGLQDQTGISGTHQVIYTGSSDYQYALIVGGPPTGGTITTSGGNTIHTFKLADTGTNFAVTGTGTVEVLVVAGGGGGGTGNGTYSGGGGGGGGGVVYQNSFAVSPGNYLITVGDGGAGSSNTSNKGTNGGNSSFVGITTALGGGGGGSEGNTAGADGGTGGGGGSNDGAAGAGSQGHQGSIGLTYAGGSGGGAGGDGAAATNPPYTGGYGGIGYTSSISGSSFDYAGGAGGAGNDSPNFGHGVDGGGDGGCVNPNTEATVGTSDTGGGGGGGRTTVSSLYGKKGGSGIVIISYPTGSLTTSFSSGFIHTLAYPMPTVPTHLGVSVKMGSAFTSNQHQYLKVDISRDGGTTFTDCHPIVKVGTHGYYRADMETITAQPSGANALAKISLTNSTTKALKGYSIYGE